MRYKKVGKNKYKKVRTVIEIVLMLLIGVVFICTMLLINLGIVLIQGK